MTTPTSRRYAVGDTVMVCGDYCVGCDHRIDPHGGIIVDVVADGDQSALFGDEPGPFYTVLTVHKHGGNLVYAEAELEPAPIPTDSFTGGT